MLEHGAGAGVAELAELAEFAVLAELASQRACLAYCGTPGRATFWLTVVDIEDVPVQILYGELPDSPRLHFQRIHDVRT